MFGKSADELAIPILAAIFGLLVLVYLIHWVTHRSDYTLYTENSQPNPIADLPREIQTWLRSNNYVLRAVEQKGYRGTSGPFTGKMSITQAVYRLVISEQGSEKRRVAWIRVGDDVKVIWEDEWRPQAPPVG